MNNQPKKTNLNNFYELLFLLPVLFPPFTMASLFSGLAPLIFLPGIFIIDYIFFVTLGVFNLPGKNKFRYYIVFYIPLIIPITAYFLVFFFGSKIEFQFQWFRDVINLLFATWQVLFISWFAFVFYIICYIICIDTGKKYFS